MRHYFTSEAVTQGHPDKICDKIADSVLDALLQQDPHSRCACEVFAGPDGVHIMGEITSKAKIDYDKIARDCIRSAGYTKPEYGFSADSCKVTSTVHAQSPDIAMGVDDSLESRGSGAADTGAGDQGIMFGYASGETPQYMPLPFMLATELSRRLTAARESGEIPYLRPDGKSQVTVEYENDRPVRVDTIVVSAQHDPDADMDALRRDITEKVIKTSIPVLLIDKNTKIYINPTGRFVFGGPAADTGLTGRKLMCDTYGGSARHGGGAFSGKDPTKVDRTAAYMARNIAKTIVEAKAAKKCEVQLGYAIGVANPVSVAVDTFGTGKLPEDVLVKWIKDNYDLRPAAMIDRFGLRSFKFSDISCCGHFGIQDLPWEETDKKAEACLKAML